MNEQRPVTGSAWPKPRVSRQIRYRERFEFALALSLSIHALILAVRFGAAGFGLPWAERREPGLQLTIRLSEVPRPAEPAPASPAVLPGLALRASPDLTLAERAKPVTPPRLDKSIEVRLSRAGEAAPLSLPQRVTPAPAPAAKARERQRKIRAKPPPPILALNEPRQDTFKVRPSRPPEEEEQRAPETAAKKQIEEPPVEQSAEQAERKQAEDAARVQTEKETRLRAEEEARQRALALQKEVEARKQEEARRLEDAKKQEEARRQALEAEARKVAEEKARQEAEELARQRAVALQKEQEAKKLEEARRIDEARKQEEAIKQAEVKKQEEAKRLTLKSDALKRAEEAAARAKEAAQRQKEQEAQAAAQRERERLAVQQAPAAAPGALSGTELAAKALEQLRTPGTVRGDPSRPPLPSASPENLRRRSIFGVERDVSVRMYVESWRWKIERNGALNYRPSASLRAHDYPVVTVSIRSDGSLENVVIHRSSGVRELDEAVRRIAQLNAPYSAFPPDLARRFDVIEIRRAWFFDTTLRILDER